ncbi:unnamed protein product [Bemisia tabaci]|uniref:Ubiquitin-like protease family profile domain-containing protein n=1 Tax=Bemisia tabaci TaxID=7038 RepID=A0A9P0AM68_BEMTA|nr:unnamed protein product [Bemisia tabaci]
MEMHISNEAMQLLSTQEWLSDEVITAYFELLQQRATRETNLPKIKTLDTYFFTSLTNRGPSAMQGRFKKCNINELELVLIPVHYNNNHWALAVYDLKEGSIYWIDSIPDDKSTELELLRSAGNTLFGNRAWYLAEVDAPCQNNSWACGEFTCAYAESVARRAPIDFETGNLRDQLRLQIAQRKASPFSTGQPYSGVLRNLYRPRQQYPPSACKELEDVWITKRNLIDMRKFLQKTTQRKSRFLLKTGINKVRLYQKDIILILKRLERNSSGV